MNKGAAADRTLAFGTRVSAIAMRKTRRKKLRSSLFADPLRISEVPCSRRLRKRRIATPVTNIAKVLSIKGAPRIAPNPAAGPLPPPMKKMAMMGMNRLRKGRANCSQYASHHALRELKFATDPLYPVGEEVTTDEDEENADEEE
jgi:hypothetical protein